MGIQQMKAGLTAWMLFGTKEDVTMVCWAVQTMNM